MSIVDYFLHALIKCLQKVQKAREKRIKKKDRALRSLRKKKKSKSAGRSRITSKRVPIKRKKRASGRPAKRILKKPSKIKKKKSTFRKKPAHSKAKAKKVKKIKREVKKVSKIKNVFNEICIGEVTHFFSNIEVIVVKITDGKLLVGDQIHIVGHSTNFVQKVKSLQIESVDVKSAKKGQLAGLKVAKRARPGDRIFKRAA